MPCGGPLGTQFQLLFSWQQRCLEDFCASWGGGEYDPSRKSTGWKLEAGFCSPQTMMPTSLRVRISSIPWDGIWVQPVLHPGMVSNACGFSCPPRVWHTPGWPYTCHLEPETLLSLSQREVSGAGAWCFQACGVACPPPWQAKAGMPKGTSLLYAVV